MPETNAEANAVKARRKTAVATAPVRPDNETGGTASVAVGMDQPARHYTTLGHPDEPRQVIGSSGMSTDAILGEDYVIATEDAYEVITPPGCTTSTRRALWFAGQQVPRERYEAHRKANATTA